MTESTIVTTSEPDGRAEQLAAKLARLGVEVGPRSSWLPDNPTGYARDFGLTHPSLLLTVDAHLLDRSVVRFSDRLRWLWLFHQAGGVGCRHHTLLAAPLTLRPELRGAADRLAATYYGTSLAAVPPVELDDAVEYRNRLRHDFGVDCQHSYAQLQESLYPIDVTAEHLRTLAVEQLPDDLSELVTYGDEFDRFTPFTRWNLLLITDNSD